MAKRLRVGEPFIGPRVSDHNAFVETYEAVKRLGLFDRGRRVGGSARIPVLVTNTTGALIDTAFPVLEIDGPIFNVDDRAEAYLDTVSLKGKTPTATATMNDLVIVQGPIPNGEARQAVLLGPTWCSVDVTDAAHTHVQPKVADNTRLSSTSSGSVKIVWKEAGTGTKKALIILGGGGAAENVRIGVTQAGGISARSGNVLGSGTVDRYTSAARPNIADTGEDDTVYNIVATPVGGMKYVVYARDVDGTWIVIVEDCT